jgi:outer membrane immunogenic protein
MKRHLLATVSTLALVSAASAADLPRAMPVKAMPPAAVWNWTGGYIGLNAGAAWLRSTFDGTDAVANTASGSTTPVGVTLGGQLGYNWQSQNFVYGIEGDLNWVDAKGSTAVSNFPGFNFNSKLTWLTTVRGRAGILVDPPTLLYVTGGFAAGGVENDTLIFGGFTDHKTRTGWTVGGGIEHKFTEHWSAKAEALYVDLGKSTVQGFFGAGYSGQFTNTAVISRLGVNYKW